MLRRSVLLGVFGFLSLQILAHEGHKPLMGTVTELDAKHIMVKAMDGKTTSILLNNNTKYRRGKIAATAADLKVGDRVVVAFKDVGNAMTATEIRLPSGGKDKKGQKGMKMPAKP